jgi:hypothetical protein
MQGMKRKKKKKKVLVSRRRKKEKKRKEAQEAFVWPYSPFRPIIGPVLAKRS